jgi:transposase-like protein
MDLHANAKLGLAGRRELVLAIEGGLSLKRAAARFSVSPATAHRWWHRWLDGGRRQAALVDRSSRPLRQPRRLSAEQEAVIVRARLQTNSARADCRDRQAGALDDLEGALPPRLVAAAARPAAELSPL